MAPPVLEYLGALTLKAIPGAELELIDANVREPAPEDINADIICELLSYLLEMNSSKPQKKAVFSQSGQDGRHHQAKD